MSPSPQLSDPGSSVYDSNTMYVGDGTWDADRNTFLLPNLMGLNFETMQYNGMGNRFREMAGYKSTIVGHGVVAAITFLGIVPAAIFIARFYHRNPRLALRLHIWLQIITVALATVIFILGFNAVGPSRALTNPHHGIGLAIYVMILFQAIFGSWMHHHEKGKQRFKIPLKLMLHQWLGRTIALLGIIQVALGLTLWGSPRILFILYALWVFFLIFLYFVLTYRNQPTIDAKGNVPSSYADYVEEDGRGRERQSGWKKWVGLGAAGAAIASMRNRSRNRREEREERRSHTDVVSSRPGSRPGSRPPPTHRRHESGSYYDEKYSDDGRERHTWRNRILGTAAVGGTAYAVKSWWDRRRGRTDAESGVGSYDPPTHGAPSVTETDYSRVQHNRPPMSPTTPGANGQYRRGEEERIAAAEAGGLDTPSRRPLRPHQSRTSLESWEDGYSDEERRGGRGHALRDGVAALGVVGYGRHLWNKRRRNKEGRRVDEIRKQDQEEERIARMNSSGRRRYTGDGAGYPGSGGRPPRRNNSMTNSEVTAGMTGSNPELSRHHLPRPTTTNIPPSQAPSQYTNLPPPPPGPPPAMGPYHQPQPPASGPGPVQVPPPPSDQGTVRPGSSNRHDLREDAAMVGLGAGATAAAAGVGSSSRRRSGSRQRRDSDNSVASPPVSVKVKMHQDGRHVTLRRLNEEEAAAEREARRRERQSNRRRRNGSISSVSEEPNGRYRRNNARVAPSPTTPQATATSGPIPMPGPPGAPPPPPGSAAANAVSSHNQPIQAVPPPPPMQAGHRPQDEMHLPPPPPIPGAAGSTFSGSPQGGAYDTGTGTDLSAPYDNNRRRRRAERAQRAAKAAGQSGGSRVEFT